MKNHWIERKETKNLRLFEVNDGRGLHWYSAEHFDEATRMHLEPLRDPQTGKHGIKGIKTSIVDSEKVMFIRMEDDGTVVTETAEEWAAKGKGLVASTGDEPFRGE